MCILADIIIEWSGEDYSTDDREYLVESIEDIFDTINIWADTYDLAKELEDELGIYPNAQLVDDLGFLFYQNVR